MPARYMELPDPLEAFDGAEREPLVGFAAVDIDEGRTSHGGRTPSVDR